jgi:uncharacterized membrane protein YkvA (DUF1232 family)
VREQVHRQRSESAPREPAEAAAVAAAAAAGAAPGGPPIPQADCPICLDSAKFAIDTNCAHTFCASCFLQYHDQSGGVLRAAVKCPCCRRTVDLVAPTEPGWTAEEKASPQGRELAASIADYNVRFSNEPRSWAAAARDTPHLLVRLWRELSSGGADSMRLLRQLRFWGLLLSGFLYLLSPFDLLSEHLLGFLGYMDDLLVLVFVAVMVGSFFRSVMVQSAARHQH